VLAGDPLTQGRFAESYATWQSVKAGLELLAGQAWQTALSGRQLTSRELAEITAGCVTAVARLRSAVGELIALAGMTGIQMGDDLARAWRDLQAVAMHGSVSARRLATAGSALLSE
jgi:alkylation response protein AidB-like acyl-CoA dehydrogenase